MFNFAAPSVFQMNTNALSMKRNFSFFLIILLVLTGCAHDMSKFSQGTWQLVSWKNMWGDTLVEEFPGDYTGSDLLIISGNHLLSISRFTGDNSKVVSNYVGATRSINGSHCEETLLFYPEQEKVGSKLKSILELRNDTLIKTYPCNENWEPIKSDYYIEKYIRVK